MSRKRFFRIGFTVCTVLLLVGVTAAQSPTPTTTRTGEDTIGAEGIGDPYFPTLGNGGYDALHYTLVVDVDVERNSLDATTTIEARATHDLSQFNLDFFGFDISEILVDGEPADFERDEEGGELTVIPGQLLEADTEFRVEVHYEGTPPERGGWTNYGDGVLVAGEPTGSSGWFPLNEHPLDKATYTIEVTVDAPLVVAANGILRETRDVGGRLTYIWEMDDPMANYLVTVAIGDFNIHKATTSRGIPIRDYYAATLEDRVIRAFERTSEMIDYFETVFGPYPFDVYGVVVHDAALGFALETQTLSVFGWTSAAESIAAHELAHQWFGDSVSLSRWQDIWLNEGFATYSELLWIEHSRDLESRDRAIRRMYSNQAERNARTTVTPNELVEGLNRVPYEDVILSREEVENALTALLGESVEAAVLSEIVEEIGDEGIAAEELPALLTDASFTEVTVTQNGMLAFFRAVKLDDLADELSRRVIIGDPMPRNLFNGAVYQRGALTLHAIRLEVGDEAFFEGLQAYTERFHDSNVTTEDFISVMEEVSGQELDDLFNTWLYEPALPDMPQMELFSADFE